MTDPATMPPGVSFPCGPASAPALACSDCGVPLKPNPRRKGTRCKPCSARAMATSAEKREKCRVAMKRHFAEPGFYQQHCQRIGQGIRAALKDPERLEDLRERGRRCGLLRLGMSRHGAGSEPRVRAGQRRSATVLAWCPIEYRDAYLHLVRSKLVRAPEARRIIEDQIAADLERYMRTGVLPQSTRSTGVTRP